MTAGFPVRAHSSHCLALVLATFLLVPSVLLFCAVHKAFDSSPLVLATGLVVRVNPEAPITFTPIESYDENASISLVQQQAEQNSPTVAQNAQEQMWPEIGAYHDTYDGLSAFGGEDIVANFFPNICQLLVKVVNAMPLQSALIVSGFLCLWTAGPVILSKL